MTAREPAPDGWIYDVAVGDRLMIGGDLAAEVTRVAADHSWVDLDCSFDGALFDQRRALPIGPHARLVRPATASRRAALEQTARLDDIWRAYLRTHQPPPPR